MKTRIDTLFILLFLCLNNLGLFAQSNKATNLSGVPHTCQFTQKVQELYEAHPEYQTELEAAMAKMPQDLLLKNDSCENVITVPVVFHYLYDPNNLYSGYDPDSYIINYIMSGLNRHFSRDANTINDNIPEAFAGTASNGTCIEWCLAKYFHPQDPDLYGNDLNRNGVKDADGDGVIDEGQYAINRYALDSGIIYQLANSIVGQDDLVQTLAPAWPTDEYLNVYVLPNLIISQNGLSLAGYTNLPNDVSIADNCIYMDYSFITADPTLAHTL